MLLQQILRNQLPRLILKRLALRRYIPFVPIFLKNPCNPLTVKGGVLSLRRQFIEALGMYMGDIRSKLLQVLIVAF